MGVLKLKLLQYVLLCFFSISNGHGEPHCSKFHFVESLLEKVVRMEFKLEQMESRYKEMERTLNEERRKLKEDGNTMNKLIENSNKGTTSKLNDMENKVKLMGEKMMKDVQDATSAMEVSRQQTEAKLVRLSADTRKFQDDTLSNITSLVKAPDVFFNVKDVVNSNPSTNDAYVFKTVLHNAGEGLNTGSGIFTAPVSGYYLFTVQLCVSGNSYHNHIAFVVDDVERNAMTVTSSKTICGTSTLISRLNTGSRVWLKCKSSSKVFQDSYRSNTYSGILLKI